MSSDSLPRGTVHELSYFVTAADAARTLRLNDEDSFPDVLATARMVALMEIASARCMRPLLGPGEHSVGVALDVRHLAATPLFVAVKVRAVYCGLEDRLHRFEVELWDAGGCAGRGTHARAVVNEQRLMEGARRRVPPPE